MGEDFKSLQLIARTAARRPRFSATVDDSEDEVTLTPRPFPSPARSHNSAAITTFNNVSFEANPKTGQLAPFELPKLPDFSNMFAGMSDSRKVESPYYQARAVSTH